MEVEDGPQPAQVKGRPIKSVDDFMGDFYNRIGLATGKTMAHLRGGNTETLRSPFTRLERGMEYHKVRFSRFIHRLSSTFNITHEVRRPDWEYFKRLDAFDNQYQSLRELEVSTEASGDQKVTYSEVFLGNESGEDENLTFVIPAFSGTIYGVESLARAIAQQEKPTRVITFNYPESILGYPSQVFVDKMIASFDADKPVNYNPHTALFAEAIRKLTPEGKKIELVVYSTGGPIAAELLSDSNFADRVANATILSPGSVTDQSKASLFLGLRNELFGVVPSIDQRNQLRQLIGNLVNTGIVTGSKIIDDSEVQERRSKVSEILMQKVCSKSESFRQARVSDGGKIIIQTGGFDKATKSNRFLPELLGMNSSENEAVNPQVVLLKCPDFTHVGPLYYADQIVKKIGEIEMDDSGKKNYTLRAK